MVCCVFHGLVQHFFTQSQLMQTAFSIILKIFEAIMMLSPVTNSITHFNSFSKILSPFRALSHMDIFHANPNKCVPCWPPAAPCRLPYIRPSFLKKKLFCFCDSCWGCGAGDLVIGAFGCPIPGRSSLHAKVTLDKILNPELFQVHSLFVLVLFSWLSYDSVFCGVCI